MKVKRVIDLTHSPLGPDNNPAFPACQVDECLSYAADGWRGEVISAATHCGTHADSPAHRLEGAPTMADIPLERFIGEAVVIDLTAKRGGEEITASDFFLHAEAIRPGDIVLLCTGWGAKKGVDSEGYIHCSPWLGASGAECLRDFGIGAVGIDHFSIGGSRNAPPAHDILLGAGILIFEEMLFPTELLGMKRPLIAAFPMKLGSVSGSFLRAVAIEFH